MKIEASFGGLPPLETKRLLLRRLKMSDVEDIFEYASGPEVTKYTLWNTHNSIEDSKKFIFWLTKSFACWAIEHKADGKVIGTCFLHSFNLQAGQAETAFNLSRKYWRQGYATEAARKVILFGFKKWELSRIGGTCMIGNIASARVLKKVGMVFEGRIERRGHDMNLGGAKQPD